MPSTARRPCGRMWQRDGGVDIMCAIDGTPHKLRLRFCLDASRTVRLMITGVAGTSLVSGEVTARGVKCTPPKHRAALVACVRNSAAMLGDEARRYLAGFTPPCRAMLNLDVLSGAVRYVRSL